MKKYLLIAAAFAALVSCQQETASVEDTEYTNGVSAVIKGFEDGDATRAELTPEDNKVAFNWNDNDQIGVIVKSGESNYRVMGLVAHAGSDGKANALFDVSEQFALAEGVPYVAFYPLQEQLNKVVPFSTGYLVEDYSTQEQKGNASAAHLNDHLYMVSIPTAPTGNNQVKFDMSPLSAVIRVNITVADAGKYSSITLKGGTNAFVTSEHYNLLEQTRTDQEYSDNVVLNLKDKDSDSPLSVEANGVITAYFMIAPTDYFKDQPLTVTLQPDEGSAITYSVNPNRQFKQGKYYRINMSPKEQTLDPDTYVDFGTGVLWAKNNVGTSNIYPYGKYYQWGDTVPVRQSQNTRTNGWTNQYQYWVSGGTGRNSKAKFSKYVTNSTYGDIDGNSLLLPEDDPAVAHMGNGWRTPTMDDFNQLYQVCNVSRGFNKEYSNRGIRGGYSTNSYSGYYVRFTSKTDRSKYIDFPLPGLYQSGYVSPDNSGPYWTRELNTTDNDHAYYFSISVQTSNNRTTIYIYRTKDQRTSLNRYMGCLVRAVHDK